jgi:hypothetical protein
MNRLTFGATGLRQDEPATSANDTAEMPVPVPPDFAATTDDEEQATGCSPLGDSTRLRISAPMVLGCRALSAFGTVSSAS